jgi:hypothetical protein
MFIGHFAVGLAAKSAKPTLSLGTYFLAAQFVDLLWPTLLLMNVEQVIIEPGITAMTPLNFIHYPITRSLVMTLVWSLAGFVLVYFLKKDLGTAILIGACVSSHWLLDFVTHRSDLPLTLSEATKVGLGLWNFKTATFLVESALFATGVFLYVKRTSPVDSLGKYAFWSLIIFLAIISIMNMVGPPRPNVAAIAWAGHLQWLFVLWAYWVDGHRHS